MSKVYVIGDLHLGHKNVTRFRTEFSSVEEHDAYILNRLESVLKKRDILYVLGDVAFTKEGLWLLGQIPCRKFLVRGNHDEFDTSLYLTVFDQVYGLLAYKRFWLSHSPIHPQELRGRRNIHGHVHTNTITRVREGVVYNGRQLYENYPDPWYINVSAEVLNYNPLDITTIPNQP